MRFQSPEFQKVSKATNIALALRSFGLALIIDNTVLQIR